MLAPITGDCLVTVVDESSGLCIAGATVEAVLNGYPVAAALTDEAGKVTFTGLPSGEYTMIVTFSGLEGQWALTNEGGSPITLALPLSSDPPAAPFMAGSFRPTSYAEAAAAPQHPLLALSATASLPVWYRWGDLVVTDLPAGIPKVGGNGEPDSFDYERIMASRFPISTPVTTEDPVLNDALLRSYYNLITDRTQLTEKWYWHQVEVIQPAVAALADLESQWRTSTMWAAVKFLAGLPFKNLALAWGVWDLFKNDIPLATRDLQNSLDIPPTNPQSRPNVQQLERSIGDLFANLAERCARDPRAVKFLRVLGGLIGAWSVAATWSAGHDNIYHQIDTSTKRFFGSETLTMTQYGACACPV
jgi:hypothetical protein